MTRAKVDDSKTAAAFAASWNHVQEGSVYTREQFLDWMAPIQPEAFAHKDVLELGYGNGSLLAHMGTYGPRRLSGVELGDTKEATDRNLAHLPEGIVDLHKGDLTTVSLGQYDLVYCIGVLHHLADPAAGFASVLRHTKPGGSFHCWVYAKEGNGVVIQVVDPIRKMASRLPWWLTKYGIALPLVVPYYLYAKGVSHLPKGPAEHLPLGSYSRWIAKRPFWFFHHVAFDQLVTPQTVYVERATLESWLSDRDVDPGTTYIVFRNGNSWKFGGRKKLRLATASRG